MPFAKGISGNPHGRPASAVSVARQIAPDVPELVARLLEISRDESCPLRERLAATMHLLDRACGKPLAPAEMSIEVARGASVLPAGFDAMPREAKLAVIADIRARALAGAPVLELDGGRE